MLVVEQIRSIMAIDQQVLSNKHERPYAERNSQACRILELSCSKH
jgi:hypothetical protein